MPPYIALSPHAKGSYGWSMDQLAAGNEMRREGWPIELRDGWTAIWHLYRYENGICNGFSSGMVGADNDSWGDLGTDSMGYSPKAEDLSATDWQFVSDVTPEQIARLDHVWPSTPNAILTEYNAKQRRSFRARVLLLLICALLGFAIIGIAHATELACPKRYACWQVRLAVSTFGEGAVVDHARACGWSEDRISEARKCMRR